MSARIGAPRRALIAAVAIGAAIAAPLGALASHQFSDVPDGNLYHADIDALVDAGITSGCGGGKYCPSQFVTREQMAAFMNRLGALAPDKTPVVNADKLDGLDSSAFLPVADITISQMAGWAGTGVTITPSNSNTDIALAAPGAATVSVGLTAPAVIGGTSYSFKNLTVCFAANSNVTITAMSVYKISGAVTLATIGDGTDTVLTSATCRTLTDGTPDAAGNFSWHLVITAVWAAGGTMEIGSLRSTWTPVAVVG